MNSRCKYCKYGGSGCDWCVYDPDEELNFEWRGTKEVLELAIQEFEDNAYYQSLHPVISEEAKAIALKAMREMMKEIAENETDRC